MEHRDDSYCHSNVFHFSDTTSDSDSDGDNNRSSQRSPTSPLLSSSSLLSSSPSLSIATPGSPVVGQREEGREGGPSDLMASSVPKSDFLRSFSSSPKSPTMTNPASNLKQSSSPSSSPFSIPRSLDNPSPSAFPSSSSSFAASAAFMSSPLVSKEERGEGEEEEEEKEESQPFPGIPLHIVNHGTKDLPGFLIERRGRTLSSIDPSIIPSPPTPTLHQRRRSRCNSLPAKKSSENLSASDDPNLPQDFPSSSSSSSSSAFGSSSIGRTQSPSPKKQGVGTYLDPTMMFGMDDEAEVLPSSKPLGFSQLVSEERDRIVRLLQEHTCYEMIPASGKIVVLDTLLPLKAAFRALIENNIKSAPLWDQRQQEYIGMITVTDFIGILCYMYNNQQNSHNFHTGGGGGSGGMSPPADNDVNSKNFSDQEKLTILQLREILKKKDGLTSIHPDQTVYQGCLVLLQNHIHRIPIMDTEDNSILHVISHHRILNFAFKNIEKLTLVKESIEKLKIGTFQNVVTALMDTPLVVVLNLLAERKISAVPLVDETGIVERLFTKSDVAALSKYPNIVDQLEKPVQDFVSDRPVLMCQRSDSLEKIFSEINGAINFSQMVCVDSRKRVEGIISLSDILRFFIGV